MNPLFLNPWFIIVAGGLLLASAGGGWYEGSSIATLRGEHRIEALQQQARLVADAEQEKAGEASTAYELGHSTARVFYKHIVQEVDNVIEGSTTVYSRECFDDDGLLLANAALAGPEAPPGEPVGGMPPPNAPSRRSSENGITQADGSQ
jgi:hypothetical protein